MAGQNCHLNLFPKGIPMRVFSNIVAGRFCGAEIEPGTFHGDRVVGQFCGGNQTAPAPKRRSGDDAPADRAPKEDALNSSLPEQEQEAPATRG
jgi:hypothetical protein